jgi:ketosteroid isomerase-like protein
MKKFTVAILVLVLVSFLTTSGFCEGTSAEEFMEKNMEVQKQVKAFYDYMQKGDVDSILTIISDDILKQISESKAPEGIGHDLGLAVAITNAIKEKILSVKILNLQLNSAEQKNGVMAVTSTYTVEITDNGKVSTEEAKDTILLKKENDKWAIFDLKQ